MNKDKACVYLRFAVYLDDETDERINDQITECVNAIEAKGLELDKVFLDLGVSGNVLLRPNLIKLLNHILNTSIKYLYVLDISRLSRNYEDYIEISKFLSANNVQIIALNQGMRI